MYNHAPKDYDCPLCRIVKRQENPVTSYRDIVLKDDFATAFIAGKWNIGNPGHVIVVPNEHYENLYDIDDKYLSAVSVMSKKIAIALKEVYECDAVSTRQHNEPDGNQDVWHFHLHIVPRYKDDNLYINHSNTKWTTEEERKPYVEKLRKYFKKE